MPESVGPLQRSLYKQYAYVFHGKMFQYRPLVFFYIGGGEAGGCSLCDLQSVVIKGGLLFVGVCSYYRSIGGSARVGSLFLVASHCKENPIYVFLLWELRGLCPNFHIHVSVSDFYIPGSIHCTVHVFFCSRIGRAIVGIYIKSLTDT